MKATINPDGMLKVRAENEIEAYALMKWSEDNIMKSQNLSVGYLIEDFKDTKKPDD